MPRHPFEDVTPEPEPEPEEEPVRIARPMPCPECDSTRGYDRVGNFRSRCKTCRSLVPNAKIALPNLNQQ